MDRSYLTISSTDSSFMCRLIDWLNMAKVEPNTTVIIAGTDPYEEIKRMTQKILDLEAKLAILIPPIPEGIYYSGDNFYSEEGNKGMGAFFHEKWFIRRDEFPQRRGW